MGSRYCGSARHASWASLQAFAGTAGRPGRCQPLADHFHDNGGDLVFQGEEVVQLAGHVRDVPGFRLTGGQSVRGDAKPVADDLIAARDDRAGADQSPGLDDLLHLRVARAPPGNLPQGPLQAVAIGDVHVAQGDESADDIIGNGVSHPVVGLPLGEVVKRQHCDTLRRHVC